MEFYVVKGIFKRFANIPKSKVGLEDFKRIAKEVLKSLSVQYTDPCCPSTGFTTLRLNSTSGIIEAFDVTSETWSGVQSNVQSKSISEFDTTGTITAAALKGGYVNSTSVAAVSMTLPIATDIATTISAAKGTTFDFIVDNSGGANTVTVVVNTGIVSSATLTVVAGAVGKFELIFTSPTAAKLVRLA